MARYSGSRRPNKGIGITESDREPEVGAPGQPSDRLASGRRKIGPGTTAEVVEISVTAVAYPICPNQGIGAVEG